MFKRIVSITSLVLFSFNSSYSATKSQVLQNLTVDLSNANSNFGADDSELFVKVVFKNPSNSSIYFADRFTPFGDIFSNMFEVTLNGEKIPYIGKMGSYGPVTSGEIKKINANRSMDTIINLADHYYIVKPGKYEIKYKSKVIMNNQNELIRTSVYMEKSSKIAVFNIQNPKTEEYYKEKFAGLLDSNCQGNQLNQAVTARAKAARISTVKSNRVHSVWFGTGSKQTVSNIINKSARALPGTVPNCTCTAKNPEKLYAYVRKFDRNHNVHLCPLFWTQDESGYDTKAATFVHEVTHFYDVGNTDDHVYGYEKAKELARTNPALALDCAENYTWYVEEHTH